MSSERINGFGPPQKMPTQVFREQWETQWIAEQRKASDVVPYTEHESSTRAPVERESSRVNPEVKSDKPANGNSHRVTEQQSAIDRAAETGKNSFRATSPAQFKAAGAQHLQSARPLVESATAGRTQVLASPSPRTPLPNQAVWRDGDSVRIALRIKDPEQVEGTVSTLRGWLRAAGLKLSELLVNGKIKGDDHGH